ncbi:phage tail family protein [Paenibacillus endoradicis]|uniref:phage tail family protein n=1 Tax=Paenibacillus endoradicis TaxID=2972487 RepID=UPI002159A74F|nr:phage tail family protein [Paenibacillus endoradicis]MCR8656926.1 phage tail family protein [Paenibacillus endoradicis]
MFNQTGFNSTPFNRSYTLDVLFSVRMDVNGASTFSPGAVYSASIEMNGEGSADAKYIREMINSIVMSGEGSLTSSVIRETLMKTIMNGDGDLHVQPKKFHIDSITVNGPFAPGDKIIIDSSKFRVSKNGMIIGYDGDVFDVNPGVNTITYKDTVTGRNILVRVSYRDRYLY